ncbi:MAG: Gfo/Idh/MocA family protein [Thermomicrobiales bacterium]
MLNVAVIGAGRRGLAHTEAVADLEREARIVGIADVDERRVHALIGAHAPHATAYTDAIAMLNTASPDVVYITTPPPLHRELTVAALERGAHVVLEKPIALTLEEAEAIGDAAARVGRLVHICHQLRYAAGSDVLRDRLSAQKVALTHIWNYRKGPDIPGNWQRSWGGGHVVEWGIHYLDLCRYVMQTEPVEVYARYTDQVMHGQENWDNWDAYALTVQWANGAVCGYASTYALKPGIAGSSGLTITAADGQAAFGWHGCTWTTPDGAEEFPGQPGDGERNLSRTFFHAIATGDMAHIRQSYDDAMKTHRLVMAANESAITGRVVRLR